LLSGRRSVPGLWNCSGPGAPCGLDCFGPAAHVAGLGIASAGRHPCGAWDCFGRPPRGPGLGIGFGAGAPCRPWDCFGRRPVAGLRSRPHRLGFAPNHQGGGGTSLEASALFGGPLAPGSGSCSGGSHPDAIGGAGRACWLPAVSSEAYLGPSRSSRGDRRLLFGGSSTWTAGAAPDRGSLSAASLRRVAAGWYHTRIGRKPTPRFFARQIPTLRAVVRDSWGSWRLRGRASRTASART